MIMAVTMTPALRNLSFADLIVGDQALVFTTSRGKRDRGAPPLSPLPAEYHEEARKLYQDLSDSQNVRETSSFWGSEREFPYIHDGVRYRVTRLATVNNIFFILRREPERVPSLSDLGISRAVRDRLCHPDLIHGLIIFSGSMASGKTTSASALVAERLMLFGGHAVTLETPPEHPLQGFHGQNGLCLQMDVHAYPDLGQAHKALLRTGNPQIIFLGELRTSHEMAHALRAANTGHLVISTLHAGNIQEAIQQLLTLAREEYAMAHELLANCLRIVIHQTLTEEKLRLQILFFDESRNGRSARAKVRNGEINHLGTEIQAQKNELLFGLESEGVVICGP